MMRWFSPNDMRICSKSWPRQTIRFGVRCTPSRCLTAMRHSPAREKRSKMSSGPFSTRSIRGNKQGGRVMRRNERGIPLFFCLFALFILTGIGIGLLYMTDAETKINDNYRASQQAYWGALAGLENVRERMPPANTGAHALAVPTGM